MSLPESQNTVDQETISQFRHAIDFSSIDADELKKLIEKYPQLLEISFENNGWIPIHYACVASNFNAVVILLNASPESVKMTQHEGLLPIHLALYGNQETNIELLNLLIEAYPASLMHQSKDGKTPLHIAVESKCKESYEVIKIILSKCPAAAAVPNNFGKLPLHLYVENETLGIEILQLLLQASPEGCKHQDAYPTRKLPLHYLVARAKSNELLPAIRLLLEIYPEGAGVGDQHGKSPLHLAVNRDTALVVIDIVSALVTACPLALRNRCTLGRLPLMDLIDRDTPYPAAIHCLLNASVSCKNILLLTERNGNSTLHIAAARENPNIEILRLLIAAEPSLPSLKNHFDSLPLHDALEVADMKCADALLFLLNAYPPAASHTNSKGLLPLHLLAMRPKPSLELARRLLEIHPDSVRHASHQGLWLPLHCAVSKSYPSKEFVELLITAYPEASITKCSIGLTPLGFILTQPHPDWNNIIPLLQAAQLTTGHPEHITYPTEGVIKGLDTSGRGRRSTHPTSNMSSMSSNDASNNLEKNDGSICTCIIH